MEAVLQAILLNDSIDPYRSYELARNCVLVSKTMKLIVKSNDLLAFRAASAWKRKFPVIVAGCEARGIRLQSLMANSNVRFNRLYRLLCKLDGIYQNKVSMINARYMLRPFLTDALIDTERNFPKNSPDLLSTIRCMFEIVKYITEKYPNDIPKTKYNLKHWLFPWVIRYALCMPSRSKIMEVLLPFTDELLENRAVYRRMGPTEDICISQLVAKMLFGK